MNANVRWAGKMSFLGVSGSGHSVVMDTVVDNGGDGSGASPMEMVLMGLAGCSGMDVVSILKKKRVQFDSFEMHLSAERSDGHPKVFQAVNIDFIFTGTNLARKPLEDSVRLSMETYCSVAGMVNKTANIDWNVLIKE